MACLPDQDKPEPAPRGCGGRARCARHAWEWRVEARVCAAEALGAALLVLVACAAGPGAGAGARAALAAATVAALVQCFDHVSGAMFNPTVLLAAALWGRVSHARACCMLAAQVLGAVCGAAALGALEPGAAARAVTRPAGGAGAARALCYEAVCGGVLALANCAAWDERNRGARDSWPLRVAVCVGALTLFAGEISGASINPARSFGPALLAGDFTDHWVYWAGPLGGALVCTALYVCVWRVHAVRCDCQRAPDL